MTPIRDSWDDLLDALFALREAVLRARLAAADAPLQGRVHIVGSITDEIVELAGICEEAVALVAPHPDDRPLALAHCQQHLAAARAQYFERVAAYELLTDLLEVGRYRGPGWDVWANNVKETIEACRPRLDDACAALVGSLLEIAGRAIPPPVPALTESAAPRRDVTRHPGGLNA